MIYTILIKLMAIPEKFSKTPHIDNVFDAYSEFQIASVAVKLF